MSKHRQRPDRRRPLAERTEDLVCVLSILSERKLRAVLARILYGATDWAIAEYFSVTPAEAAELVRSGLAKLRHPDCLQVLQGYRDDRDHTLLIDNDLRDLIRDELLRGRLEEAFAPVCHLCGLTFVCERLVLQPGGKGRPRKYCSNACRQKAYRKRNR